MRTSIIIILFIVSKLVVGQIPNNGFETWNSFVGYTSPSDWDNLNQMTYSKGVSTCIKGTPGYPGASYLFLISKTVTGKGVVPGRVVSGKIDTNTYKPISGYPFSNRPQVLNYNIQYMPYDPSDSTSVKVLLTKWNVGTSIRDTVAYGASYYNAMAHSWFVGSTYLNYLNGDAPDSAMIVISSSSSNPKDGSYIYIDNLQFNGSVIGIEERQPSEKDVEVYPNPASNSISIKVKDNAETTFIYVYDAIGKQIYALRVLELVNINTSSWEKGFYTFRIIQNNKYSINKKIIIE
ncbi:MAG: hypothetical protein C0446_13990 [Chitinophaga sp.]|jgi:hypothetical protein|nr:hypothetical protein [Chitinophaga sp.]MDP3557748.1 T9SS type A sorting domain-containing protein [Bacteroidota bacterium]